MNAEKITKIAKWVAYGIEAAFVVVFIVLCVAVAKKNHTIKEYKAVITEQAAIMDSLNHTCAELWGEDCIKVDVICNIQQKGMVNLNQSTQVARSVATYTRGEVLMAMDSLERINNQE